LEAASHIIDRSRWIYPPFHAISPSKKKNKKTKV